MASVIHPVLTHDYLLTVIAETRKQLDTTPELERQIKAIRRKLEELVIAIQRTLNTIEKTESSAAQERLKQREADKAGAQANLQNSGLAWKDHEFSTGVLDKGPIGWDWFSLQFDNGPVLILFQLRESGGGTSDSLSGTFINAEGVTQSLQNENFRITVLDQWRSPHTGGIYPAAWKIQLEEPNCELNIQPWMADQEVNFPAVPYWEGGVRFEGTCTGEPVNGNGSIELTGYAGNLPLP